VAGTTRTSTPMNCGSVDVKLSNCPPAGKPVVTSKLTRFEGMANGLVSCM
jgi:hypothetical protein